jgi:hypothetical protein
MTAPLAWIPIADATERRRRSTSVFAAYTARRAAQAGLST